LHGDGNETQEHAALMQLVVGFLSVLFLDIKHCIDIFEIRRVV